MPTGSRSRSIAVSEAWVGLHWVGGGRFSLAQQWEGEVGLALSCLQGLQDGPRKVGSWGDSGPMLTLKVPTSLV